MNIVTGQVVSMEQFERSSYDSADWVMVEGTPEQIESLSRRTALGTQELQRRAKRREIQKKSRKTNRKR